MKKFVLLILLACVSKSIGFVYADEAPLSGSSSQQIQQLNTQIQGQFKQIQTQQQQQLEKLNSQVQGQLKQMQSQLQEQLQKLNSQTQSQIQQVQTTLQQQIKLVHEEVMQNRG
jgi:hypothetical protein